MEQKILSEIYRAQQLMGVEKRILSEAAGPGKPIANLMQSLLKNLYDGGPATVRFVDDVLGRYMGELGQYVDKEILERIAKGDFINEFTENQAKELQRRILEAMEKSYAYKQIVSEFYTKTIKENLPFVIEHSFNTIERRMSDLEDNILNSANKNDAIETANKIYREFVDAMEKAYPGVKDELTKAIEKRIGRGIQLPLKDVSWAVSFWENFYKKTRGAEFEYYIQNFRKYIDLWLIGSKKLRDELSEINKKIEDIKSSSGAIPETLYARATAIIYSLRGDASRTIETIISDLITTGKITPEFAEDLRKSDRFIQWLEGGKKWSREEGGSDPISIWSASVEEFNASLKAIYGASIIAPFVKNIGDPQYMKMVIKDIIEGYKRVLSYVVTTSPRLPSEVVVLKNSLGYSKLTLLGNVVASKIIGSALLPAQLATLLLIGHSLAEIPDIMWPDFHKWGEDDFGPEWSVGKWWLDTVTQLQGFSEVQQFLFQSVKENHGQVLLFWTKLDEAWDLLARGNNEEFRKKIKELENEIRNEMNRIKNDIKNLEQKSEDELRQLKIKWEQIKNKCKNDPDTEGCDKVDEVLEAINKLLNTQEEEDQNGGNQNGGGGAAPVVDPNPGEEIQGLEQEMKNAFNSWAANNANRNPSWVEYNNDTGYVMVDGRQYMLKRTNANKLVILTTPNPTIIN
jgi:hypothetical protein